MCLIGEMCAPNFVLLYIVVFLLSLSKQIRIRDVLKYLFPLLLYSNVTQTPILLDFVCIVWT